MKKSMAFIWAIPLFGLVTNTVIEAKKGENHLPGERTNGPGVLGRETKVNGRQS